MATQINNQFNDLSTEEKIKNSARAVFHRKGFAAARTRDIAQEAGINLALLNYYFRSKEKLFNIVMLEAFQSFFSSISIVFNDANSTLDEKIRKFAADYIDLLFQEPEIPLFIMSEIRNNPDELLQKIDLKSVVFGSVFFNQYNEAIRQGKISHSPGENKKSSFSALYDEFHGLNRISVYSKTAFKRNKRVKRSSIQ